MSTASKGAAFERLCRKELEETGWHVVRAAGSKGPADLWAVRRENGIARMIVVQVKASRRAIGPREWNSFCQFAEMIVATPVIADKLPGRRQPCWWRITGLKGPGRTAQPRVPFDIEAWRDDA